MGVFLLTMVLNVGHADSNQIAEHTSYGQPISPVQSSCCLNVDPAADTESAFFLHLAAVPPDRLRELEVMREINRAEKQIQHNNPYNTSTPKKRKAWEKRIRLHIRKNSIISGMEPEHVLQSWGKPTAIEAMSQETEKWIYTRSDGRNQIIYFDRGQVAGWE
ncbi:MAG: hypothetical protein OQJ91_10670 [Motiliproteus sp.]|nr:hypothetical protein [Motiliproteus sp.]